MTTREVQKLMGLVYGDRWKVMPPETIVNELNELDLMESPNVTSDIYRLAVQYRHMTQKYRLRIVTQLQAK